jgi:hypothetical protein
MPPRRLPLGPPPYHGLPGQHRAASRSRGAAHSLTCGGARHQPRGGAGGGGEGRGAGSGEGGEGREGGSTIREVVPVEGAGEVAAGPVRPVDGPHLLLPPAPRHPTCPPPTRRTAADSRPAAAAPNAPKRSIDTGLRRGPAGEAADRAQALPSGPKAPVGESSQWRQ